MPVSDLRRRAGEILDDLQGECQKVYVTRYGHPIAVLVAYEQYERLKAASTQAEGPSRTDAIYPRPGALHPTVVNEPSNLDRWLDLIPDGCGGDALRDTETLCDED